MAKIFCSDECRQTWRKEKKAGVTHPEMYDKGLDESFPWHDWHVHFGLCPQCRQYAKQSRYLILNAAMTSVQFPSERKTKAYAEEKGYDIKRSRLDDHCYYVESFAWMPGNTL